MSCDALRKLRQFLVDSVSLLFKLFLVGGLGIIVLDVVGLAFVNQFAQRVFKPPFVYPFVLMAGVTAILFGLVAGFSLVLAPCYEKVSAWLDSQRKSN